jgi:hypothetical protein
MVRWMVLIYLMVIILIISVVQDLETAMNLQHEISTIKRKTKEERDLVADRAKAVWQRCFREYGSGLLEQRTRTRLEATWVQTMWITSSSRACCAHVLFCFAPPPVAAVVGKVRRSFDIMSRSLHVVFPYNWCLKDDLGLLCKRFICWSLLILSVNPSLHYRKELDIGL